MGEAGRWHEWLFQFTPLREGRRRWGRRGAGRWRHFNSRPSARGDFPCASRCAQAAPISIHAPPRGATLRCDFSPFELCSISIHAPPRGATAAFDRWMDNDYISIHAPPRGATVVKVPICRATEISIHAPPRGATIPLWTFRRGAAHFNSRPSARGDRQSIT